MAYEEDVISIFMQYIPGSDLATVLETTGPLAEPVIAKYTRQLLRALEYIHSHHVLHRSNFILIFFIFKPQWQVSEKPW